MNTIRKNCRIEGNSILNRYWYYLVEIFRVYLNNMYTSFYTQTHMRHLSSSLHDYLCVHYTHFYKSLILLIIIRVLRLFQLLLLVLLAKPVKWSTNSESCETAKTQGIDCGFKPYNYNKEPPNSIGKYFWPLY